MDEIVVSQADWSSWIDNLGEIVFLKDTKGKYIRVNREMTSILGIPHVKDAEGKSDFHFFSRDLSQKFWNQDKQVFGNVLPIHHSIENFNLANGQTKYYAVSKYPWKSESGEIIGVLGVGCNISTLFEKFSLLDYLFQNFPDLIFVKDLNHRYTLANPAKLNWHMLKSPEEIQGKSDYDLFTPELGREIEEDERKVIHTKSPVIGREEYEVMPEGDKIWLSTTRIPVLGKDGEVSAILGISRDITKIKTAEERLEILMDNLPDPIYFKDEKSRFTLINRAHSKMFGLARPSDALGKSDHDFFLASHADKAREDEVELMRTGIPVVGLEELEIHKDGRVTWALTTKLPLRDHMGKIIGTFGLSRDITKMKLAEEQIRYLMDNIPDTLYFKDISSVYTRINRSFAKKLKLEKPEDAVGKTVFDFFDRQIAQAAFDDDKRVMETGEAIIGKEEIIRYPGEEATWVSVTKLPMYNHEGKLLGTFGLSRDITQLKKAEEELQKVNENLEAQVSKRTVELRQANLGMEARIRQLNYLNETAHTLAGLIDKEKLLHKVFDIFSNHFPNGQIHIVEMQKSEMVTVHSSDLIKKDPIRHSCIHALEYMEVSEDGNLYFEGRWMDNPLLQDLFHSDLREFPCYLEIPLSSDKRLRGVIQVFAQRSYEQKFSQETSLLNTLAAQISIALDNANHYLEVGEKTRLESELEIAQRIQKRYVPSDPVIPNIILKGFCHAANEVGGDYLDYFQNDRGDWVIVIADVCGKGIPAALVMTSLRSIFRTEARNQKSSKELMCVVNRFMGKDLQLDNSFITCLCIILDADGNTLNFTRAGHPMMVRFSKNSPPENLKAQGIALGMVIDESFSQIVKEVQVDIHPGDRFFAYTDGLTETMNRAGDSYGVNRLMELIEREKLGNTQQLIDALLIDLKEFAGDLKQHDDLTMFSFERLT